MLLRNATVFDGRRWLGRTSIRVTGSTVAQVGADLEPRSTDRVIDLEGQFILPGLVDSHLHLFPGFLARLPSFGVTFAVDMFCTSALRRRLDAEGRRTLTARFTSCGIGAAASGGHPHQFAGQGFYETFPALDSTNDAYEFVKARAAEGASFVKVFIEDGQLARRPLPTMSQQVVEQVTRLAHEHGMSVVAHVMTGATARRAIDAGVDGLAHTVVPGPRETDDLAEVLSQSGAFVVTTLSAVASLLGQRDALLEAQAGLLDRAPGWRRHAGSCAGPPDGDSWERVGALVGPCSWVRTPQHPASCRAWRSTAR